MSVFKMMRIVVLLSILIIIVAGTWLTEKRLASWERPVFVTVYPLLQDTDPATRAWAEKLDESSFDEINRFFEHQMQPYGFTVTPAFRFQIAPVSEELPPPVPDLHRPAAVAWWSLRMRWWAWRRNGSHGLPTADVQMFVIFRNQASENEVALSVGMRKGRYGIVRAVAYPGRAALNRVLFTHELLHVFGATDKYTAGTMEPIFPEGYADPQQSPLFPQDRAEIMGGRVPVTSWTSRAPVSLEECKIGRVTAEEIGFFDRLSLR